MGSTDERVVAVIMVGGPTKGRWAWLGLASVGVGVAEKPNLDRDRRQPPLPLSRNLDKSKGQGEKRMEKRSKELLEFEHRDPCSSAEAAALLICGNNRKLKEEKKPKPDGQPLTQPPPKSQVLDRVKGFLGVLSEANKSLQLKPEDYNIEVLNGDESEYIEMDLMLGVADLHTPEAVAAAEAAIAGKQPVLDLPPNACSSDSEMSSDDDDDDEDDEHMEDSSSTDQESERKQSKGGPKSKRPKIVELS